jgi:hypothetical protein
VRSFRLPPPSELNSGRYANDYNDIKLPGSATAGADMRPTGPALLPVSSPLQAWNPAARQVSDPYDKSFSENAIFVLLAMAVADASQPPRGNITTTAGGPRWRFAGATWTAIAALPIFSPTDSRWAQFLRPPPEEKRILWYSRGR